MHIHLLISKFLSTTIIHPPLNSITYTLYTSILSIYIQSIYKHITYKLVFFIVFGSLSARDGLRADAGPPVVASVDGACSVLTCALRTASEVGKREVAESGDDDGAMSIAAVIGLLVVLDLSSWVASVPVVMYGGLYGLLASVISGGEEE